MQPTAIVVVPEEPRRGLADAVRALRSELTTVLREGCEEALRFELGPVEREFLLEVQRDTGGEAAVKCWVVNVGGKGTLTHGSTHRVTLSLTPRDAAARAPRISDKE